MRFAIALCFALAAVAAAQTPVRVTNSNDAPVLTRVAPVVSVPARQLRTRWFDCAPFIMRDGGTMLSGWHYLAARQADGGQYGGGLECEHVTSGQDVRTSPTADRFWFDPYDPTFQHPLSNVCQVERLDAGTLTCEVFWRLKNQGVDGGWVYGSGVVGGFQSAMSNQNISSLSGSAVTSVSFLQRTNQPVEFGWGFFTTGTISLHWLPDGGTDSVVGMEMWEGW